MAPIFFSLGNRLQIMVIREPYDYLDNQKTLTENHAIFLDMAERDPRQSRSKEASSLAERLADPDYCGAITRQSLESMYTYAPNGKIQLSPNEVEQLIEQLSAP